MFFNKNQNKLRKRCAKVLPYLLIFYFISFRCYFLLQQFVEQNHVAAASYFDVFKGDNFAKKLITKIAPAKDSSSQKRSVAAFSHEYEFFQLENFTFIFLLFAIIFYCKTQLSTSSPPLFYRNRAPPAIC